MPRLTARSRPHRTSRQNTVYLPLMGVDLTGVALPLVMPVIREPFSVLSISTFDSASADAPTPTPTRDSTVT